jgi:hypothetical protein
MEIHKRKEINYKNKKFNKHRKIEKHDITNKNKFIDLKIKFYNQLHKNNDNDNSILIQHLKNKINEKISKLIHEVIDCGKENSCIYNGIYFLFKNVLI